MMWEVSVLSGLEEETQVSKDLRSSELSLTSLVLSTLEKFLLWPTSFTDKISARTVSALSVLQAFSRGQ